MECKRINPTFLGPSASHSSEDVIDLTYESDDDNLETPSTSSHHDNLDDDVIEILDNDDEDEEEDEEDHDDDNEQVNENKNAEKCINGMSKESDKKGNKSNDGPNKKKIKISNEVDELVDNYIIIFERKCGLSNEQKVDMVQKLRNVIDKLKNVRPKYMNSKEFISQIKLTTNEIEEEYQSNRIIMHHNDLLKEFNRISIVKTNKKSQQDKKDKAKIKKQIDKLTQAIKKVNRQICEAESSVLSYDDMLNSRTEYTDVPKLMKKVIQLWEKREQLLNRSTKSWRYSTTKFTFSGTDYPLINKEIEIEVNKFLKRLEPLKMNGYKNDSFTILEIRKIIENATKKHNIYDVLIDSLAEDVFKKIRIELKRRREMEDDEAFESYTYLEDLLPETSVKINNNSLLEKDLTLNNTSAKQKMDEIIDKYHEKDLKENPPDNEQSEPEWTKQLNEDDKFEFVEKEDDLKEEQETESDDEDDVDYTNEPSSEQQDEKDNIN